LFAIGQLKKSSLNTFGQLNDDFFKEIHQSETRIAYAATMFVNGS
jgi:hypothetical protein